MSEKYIDKIEKIEKLEKIATGQNDTNEAMLDGNQNLNTSKVYFDDLMDRPTHHVDEVKMRESFRTVGVENTNHVTANNPIAMNSVHEVQKISPAELKKQTDLTVEKFEKLKVKLQQTQAQIDASNANVDFKKSHHDILRNKISHIDESIQIALSKAGGEYTPIETRGNPNVIEKFLGFITHGQSQLKNLGNELEKMNAVGHEISLSKMLVLQLKIGVISQEVEFFSNCLSKSLDGIKTMMNIQV